MWFKNLQIYRLPQNWAFTPEQMEDALQSQAFTPASSNELLRQGWASPRENDRLVHAVHGQFLLSLATEKKVLPSKVIPKGLPPTVRVARTESVTGSIFVRTPTLNDETQIFVPSKATTLGPAPTAIVSTT